MLQEPVLKKKNLQNQVPGSADDDAIPNIPFNSALNRHFGDDGDVTMRGRAVMKRNRMKTMPKYLLVQVQRYYHCTQSWVQKKRECTCPVPEKLDLEKFRAEVLLK